MAGFAMQPAEVKRLILLVFLPALPPWGGRLCCVRGFRCRKLKRWNRTRSMLALSTGVGNYILRFAIFADDGAMDWWCWLRSPHLPMCTFQVNLHVPMSFFG